MFRELNLGRRSSVESTGSSVVTRRIVRTPSYYTHTASHGKTLKPGVWERVNSDVLPFAFFTELRQMFLKPHQEQKEGRASSSQFFCLFLFCFVFQFACGKRKRGKRCVHECSHFSSPPRVIIQVVIKVKFWKSVFFCLSLFG